MKITPSNKPNYCQQALIDRRYGMFIHFGINTFNDTEWSNGKLPIESYRPTAIDADQWVKNAKDVGMKYVILITKHHDGFCLWDTHTTTYSVNYSSNKTDVVAAVAAACKKYDIQLGLYYSLWDRHEKCYRKHQKYQDYMINHLTELFTRYGEICELWLDGGWDKTNNKWGIERIYDHVKTLQPNCAVAVNITIGKFNNKGFVNKKFFPANYTEGMPMQYFPSDFRLSDPKFPPINDPKLYTHDGEQYYLPFEATICIRNMSNWFWDPKYCADKLIEVEFITDKYKTLIGQSNSMIINVAPNTDGRQEQSDIDHLMLVKKQLKL